MADSDDPRDRLLAAAGEIFAEKGFEGATVRKIIERAGVNIAGVNYYFRDKERLYIEAVKRAACGAPGEAPAWPTGTAPALKLRDFIRQMVRHLFDPNRPAWHARLMMREMAQPTSACAELVRDYIGPRAAVLEGVIRELVPPQVPRWKRLMISFSIVGQMLFYVSHKPILELLAGPEALKHFDEATVAEHVTEFSLQALGVSAAARKRVAAEN
ncbi:MAG TPA: CerR family C-terminal domain-containing protein [Gemmataceae bacterium]|jgi:AcrR family transcriptional regulator|nr:CerR family C-terminal domain-containing protein [Gemmataceae bacterium]